MLHLSSINISVLYLESKMTHLLDKCGAFQINHIYRELTFLKHRIKTLIDTTSAVEDLPVAGVNLHIYFFAASRGI